jgi:hypothetical protein
MNHTLAFKPCNSANFASSDLISAVEALKAVASPHSNSECGVSARPSGVERQIAVVKFMHSYGSDMRPYLKMVLSHCFASGLRAVGLESDSQLIWNICHYVED